MLYKDRFAALLDAWDALSSDDQQVFSAVHDLMQECHYHDMLIVFSEQLTAIIAQSVQ